MPYSPCHHKGEMCLRVCRSPKLTCRWTLAASTLSVITMWLMAHQITKLSPRTMSLSNTSQSAFKSRIYHDIGDMMSENTLIARAGATNTSSTLVQENELGNQSESTSLIEIRAHRLYLFSAILKRETRNLSTGMSRYDLLIAGWLLKNDRPENYKCCVWMQTDEIVSVKVKKISPQLETFILEGVQFHCSLSHASSIRSVSITMKYSTCPKISDTYLNPYWLGPSEPGLAVCSKIGFWSLDAKFLVEWFEIVRLLGVSKVISYTYELNADAMKVLRYYEGVGFVDVYAFDYPDKERLVRRMHEENGQIWNDQEVALYDCVERLANYKYVATMDKDEIIVPETDNLLGALLQFVETQLQEEPQLGTMFFKTQMHFITGEALQGNTMYTDHYHQCSTPLLDRRKNIWLPSRAISGRITTHFVNVAKGFKSKLVPLELATIHHYRKPRSSYALGIKKVEQNMNCTIMQRLAEMVRESTAKIRTALDLL